MKKLIVLTVFATALCGCYRAVNDKDINDPWTMHGGDCKTKVIKIEGHKYILMDGYYSGGIVHAASCDCLR